MNVTLDIWFCVDKSGQPKMFLDIPKRQGNIWVGKQPFVNSILYHQIKEMIDKTKYGWTNDPECLKISF